MRIHRITVVLYLILLAIGAAIYFLSEEYGDHSPWIIVPGIGIALVYVFRDEIDGIWWKKNPPSLPPKMNEWLQQYSVFYNLLPIEKKAHFEREMAVFIETKQFYIVGKEVESVPYDIKGIVAHEAIKLILLLGSNPFDHINRIVLYKHAFPTPKLKELHTVETELEDGVIIFSLEHLIPGILSPNVYYNIGMHGYLALAKNKKLQDFLHSSTHFSIEELTEKMGFTREILKANVGEGNIHIPTIAANYYIEQPEKFTKNFESKAKELNQILGQY